MTHKVEQVSFDGTLMTMKIDGKLCSFDLGKVSPRFLNVSMDALMTYEISPSGYGIHWPLLDEDISIDGLLGVTHQPKRKKLSMAV